MTNNPEESRAQPHGDSTRAAPKVSCSRPHGNGFSSSSDEAERRGGLGPLGWTFLVLLWGYASYRLGMLWVSQEQYSYGWFVPLLCLCLFWERWKQRPRRSPVRAGSGTFIALGFFALTLLPAVLYLTVIPHGRMAAWLLGLAVVAITLIALYFIGGRNYTRHFIFPVLFLLVAIPWPLRYEVPLIQRMSELNAGISARVASHLGTAAVRTGVIIETGSGPVGVDEACSGIRSLQASVMVGLFLGELFQFGFFRRVLLLFGGVGIAFFCNVVRTTYLVRTCDLKGLSAVNLYHDQAGLAILGITFTGLLLLAWALWKSWKQEERSKREEWRGRKVRDAGEIGCENPAEIEGQNPEAKPGQFESLPPVTPTGWLQAALIGVIVWLAVIETGKELWFGGASREAATQSTWAFKLPSLGREFRQLPLSEGERKLLRYDEGTKAEWRDAGGRVWQLYYLRWLPAGRRYGAVSTSAKQLGHTTDICLVGAGMILQTNLGTQFAEVNGVGVALRTERLLSRGRTFHLFTVTWNPGISNADSVEQSDPYGSRIQLVYHALRTRDRGDQEQRVIKVGVWGMTSDEEAEAAFKDYLERMVGRERGEKAKS